METIEARTERWRPQRRRDRLVPGPTLLVSRGLLYLLLALLASVAIWTTITAVDVIVEAKGRVAVEGQPIELTVASAALVTEIPVRVGQEVRADDVLLVLDVAAELAEIERIEKEIETRREEVERYRDGAARLERSRQAASEELDTLERIVHLNQREVERNRLLESNGVTAPAEVSRQERNLLESRARHAQKRGEIERLARQTEEDRRRAQEASLQIAEHEVRIEELQLYVERASLRAPVSGTVVRLALRHPGSVVGTDEPVVVIAPDDAPLQAIVEIPNQSMRKLAAGAAARVVFDAFPREDYGTVSGSVVEIEPDSNEAGDFRAVLSLDRADDPGSPILSQLKPGLGLAAQIVIEERRLLDYLLLPFDRLSRPLTVVQ